MCAFSCWSRRDDFGGAALYFVGNCQRWISNATPKAGPCNHIQEIAQGRISGRDLAIAGIGCRFPVGAKDPQTLRGLLDKGFNAIMEAPASRPRFRYPFDPDPKSRGKPIRAGADFSNTSLFLTRNSWLRPLPAGKCGDHELWQADPHAPCGSQTGILFGQGHGDDRPCHQLRRGLGGLSGIP